MLDKTSFVKQSAYMNFKEATDGLFDRVSHQELADSLGVSVASIRQARLDPKAKAYRTPPPNWQDAVIRLSEKYMVKHRKLIEKLAKDRNPE
jgi:hypothetical protein